MTYLQKQKKKLQRQFRKYGKSLFSFTNIAVLAVVLLTGSVILHSVYEKKSIYTADLLSTIAKVESKGNYNAYFGNATNAEVIFTAMPVRDVLAWQNEFIAQGNASSAVGRYQFVNTTLSELVTQLRIDSSTLFDKQLQDKLAVALLERRGLQAYISKQITRDEFAHNLSMEWAALPRVIGDNPNQSYYEGDGLNQARLSIDEIYAGIDSLHEVDG
ncbi:hypothetical protein HY312_02425 [Candidatus Saccharibacteria bacterium]|nr:hypothetical protein [Candidatus Saccharibacteria bacterium]